MTIVESCETIKRVGWLYVLTLTFKCQCYLLARFEPSEPVMVICHVPYQ